MILWHWRNSSSAAMSMISRIISSQRIMLERLMWQTCLIKRGIWFWRLKFLSLMVRIKYCIVLKSKYKTYLALHSKLYQISFDCHQLATKSCMSWFGRIEVKLHAFDLRVQMYIYRNVIYQLHNFYGIQVSEMIKTISKSSNEMSRHVSASRHGRMSKFLIIG